MKKIIINCVIIFVVGLLVPQIVQSQGTIYMSNLSQASAGSLAVGKDSWLAALFVTGTNAGGYFLNSVQLGMTDVSGNPSDFTVMVYRTSPAGLVPLTSLGTLSGSANPATSGIYTYNPASTITLLPNFDYFIVLAAGTTMANGAYEWSNAGANSYSPSSGWSSTGGFWTSNNNGSQWNLSQTAAYPQYAINATIVPEPSTLAMLGLGSLGFLLHRRKLKPV